MATKLLKDQARSTMNNSLNLPLIELKRLALIPIFMLFGIIAGRSQDYTFPTDWQGKWSGTLEIFRGPQKVDSLPMSLEIVPKDDNGTFSYKIQYGPDANGIRDYTLLTVDAAKGHYAVDEHNGITLSAYVIGDKFVSHFEVMGNFLTSTSYRQGDRLMYEITSGAFQSEYTTGDTVMAGQEIPPVQSFPVTILQVAELRRAH